MTEKTEREMFPPVIVFTKWEQLEEQAAGKRWKQQNPGGLETRIGDLINILLDKMKEAGISHIPFFADVNAWDAYHNSAAEDQEIKAAQANLTAFLKDLVMLGSSLATPIYQCRMLELQVQRTQAIINKIHSEDGEKVMATEDINDLKVFGDSLKDRFSNKVKDYFKDIEWTDYGLAKYKPCQPFTRESCAINQIPSDFESVFEQYRLQNPDVKRKAAAVQKIVQDTLEKVQKNIVLNFGEIEADAIKHFREEFWKRVGCKSDKDIEQQLVFSSWQRGVLAGLPLLSFIGARVAGQAAFAAAACRTAATMAGGAVGVAGLVATVAWWGKDEIGGWTWEEGKRAAWKAVLDACRGNAGKLEEHVNTTFVKRLDKIIKDIEDCRTSQCQASKIRKQAFQGQTNIAKRFFGILNERQNRWLGNPTPKLKQICDEVLKQRASNKDPINQEYISITNSLAYS